MPESIVATAQKVNDLLILRLIGFEDVDRRVQDGADVYWRAGRQAGTSISMQTAPCVGRRRAIASQVGKLRKVMDCPACTHCPARQIKIA